MRSAVLRFTTHLATAAVITCGSTALAQTAAEEDADPNAIIVTAQKREQDVRDVPIAINAFGKDEIALRGIDSIADLATQVPGLTFGEIAGVGQINLRGIGFGVVSGAGENSVAIHYDGVYIANPGASVMVQHDLGSIEVLRGPQGTLYGRNATAGVINFVSAAPTDRFEGGGRVGYGNFDAITASGELSGPLGQDVSVRVSGDYIGRNGYVRNLALGGDEGDLKRIAGRFSLDADLGPDLVAKVRLFHASEDSGAPFYDPVDTTVLGSPLVLPSQIALDPYEIRTNRHSSSDKRLTGASLRLELGITDTVKLISTTGLVDYRFDVLYDGDGTSGLTFENIDRAIEDKTVSQEILLQGDTKPVEWTLGGYYLDQSVDIESATQTPGLRIAGLNSIANVTKEDIESFALFGDATVRLGDRLKLFGGVRYLNEKRNFDQTQIQELDVGLFAPPFAPIGVFAPVPVCQNLKLSRSDEHVTGRVGVSGEFGAANFYGTFSTGYKSGGFASSSCNDPFNPEKLNAYEVGAKIAANGGAVRINVAAFYYDYSDFQVEEIVAPNIFVNNADARVFGVEFDALARVSDAVTLNAGVTWINAQFSRFTNLDAFAPASGFQDLRGNPMIRSPKFQFAGGVRLKQPISDSIELVLRGDVTATSGYQLREFDAAADRQDGYITGNAAVELVFEDRFMVRGWVRNIANEAVLGGLLNGGALAPARLGSYALPRTYGIEIGVKF